MFNRIFSLAPGFFDGGATQALLYLDPGTGSLLFSVILGIASTAYFVARDVLYRLASSIKVLLSGRQGAQTGADPTVEHPVVFFSEGRQYQSTFRPLLRQMAERGLPCLYLSNDADDPLLALRDDPAYPLLQVQFIGSGHLAWARMRTLRARLVCMTTPGLDVLQLRRSPHVRHYMHVVHSPTDKSFNRTYSFDFFDSVLINGPHQERVLRALEQLRGRKAKALYNAGCLYYDSLLPKYQAAQQAVDSARAQAPGRPLRVLVAPTWGKNGLLARFGAALIAQAARADVEVVVRPHPQSRVSESELLERVQRETAALPNCSWDASPDAVAAMAGADILISDISGIVFDFAFLTGRPVLTLDFPIDKRGFEAMDLPFEPWELAILDRIGRRIGMDDMAGLADILAREAADGTRAQQIRRLRDEYVCNFGCASAAAVDEIARLADLRPHVSQAAVVAPPFAAAVPAGR
ncbi:CDP-glycerol glycerophosphotransferase family protein [Pseudoduganella chitinolytica]|uniref:CDP-glycerol glycerophosphotransferase family protein n=1 Tax=Pseudoduganella chitinolytica TaxID=34070 RepID=A0ABY8B646_9BURK|nr:CDP-glycerol glycerophosphotransferase family protein [Pseudoduganella chitinolytica]WEF31395.1 CDP-glycerol glycerophosphotransferase family protein [Pseudoduganella chitinolytica]